MYKLIKNILFSLLLPSLLCFAQDSLKIHYSIVQMEFHGDHDVIKIKVPNWLKTSELISQLKYIVQWPGDPPPRKKIYVYVFKETDPIGSQSRTGCVYTPGKGFLWDLRNWNPEEFSSEAPSDSEINIYNTFVDSLLANGITSSNQKVKEKIARLYDISVSRLDSIYVKVRYWWENGPQPKYKIIH
ncbi:MAG: hypothetical protein P8184_19370 [Calditrichia bacterium]